MTLVRVVYQKVKGLTEKTIKVSLGGVQSLEFQRSFGQYPIVASAGGPLAMTKGKRIADKESGLQRTRMVIPLLPEKL